MRNAIGIIAGLVLATVAASAEAQKTTQLSVGNGGSPHVKSEWVAGGANISITYGRPSLKGRAEATLMPAGQPWRTGADEATIITTDKPLKFGAVALQPGTYTINTQPGATEWQLIIGKLAKPGQWGVPYDASLEIGRAPMKIAKAKTAVEQVTLSIDNSANGGTLRLEWGTQSATIPFTVGK